MQNSGSAKEQQTASSGENRAHLSAFRVALIYAVFGGLWILVSDLAVSRFLADQVSTHVAQTLKGVLYVLVTAGLVYWLAARAFQSAERKFLKDQLEKSEELLEAVLTNLDDAVFFIEPSTRTITKCNSVVRSMFGFEPGELIGKRSEILHVNRESYEDFGKIAFPELEKRGVFRCHYQLRHKEGTPIETEITVIATHGDLGWQGGVVSIVRDVSERVRAEQALRTSEERYRLLAENTLDVIWSMNTDFEFTYVNPAIEPLTGYTPEEYVGTVLPDHCGKATFERITKIVEQEIAKGPEGAGVVVDTELLRKDGSPVPVEVHAKVLFNDEGHPIGFQGTTRDITERRAMEAQLRQAEKLEAVGTLASGVAHEINNPLHVIGGYAELIRSNPAADAKTRQHSLDISRQAEHIQTIVKNLLGFARKEEQQPPEPAGLKDIVDSTLSLIRTAIRHDSITLNVNVPGDLPMIECRPQQMQQVVMNLVTNARDALNAKYPGPHSDKQLSVSAQSIEKGGKNWIRLTVEDSGSGIPDEVRERIFEPFFTTKPAGKGTGLGMWIIYDIVNAHGGEVNIESELGSYSRFHIDLPARS